MFFESDHKNKVILDYYDTPIQSNPFEKTPLNGGYIKFPFQNPKGIVNPNLILSDTNEKYKTENIYILNNSHSIHDIKYDGEFIIEHQSLTDQDKKIYVVFLLQMVSTRAPSFIDDIINASLSTNTSYIHLVLNLNEILDNKTSMLGNRFVYVFDKPISVNSSFNLFKTNSNFLFPKYGNYSSKYHKTIMAKMFLPFLEGFDGKVSNVNNDNVSQYMNENADINDIVKSYTGKNIDGTAITTKKGGSNTAEKVVEGIKQGDSAYMECSPTGTSVDTIEMYNVPVNGEFASDLSKISLYRLVINMFLIIILIFIVVMIVPSLYKQFVINYLIKNFVSQQDQQSKFLIVLDFIWRSISCNT